MMTSFERDRRTAVRYRVPGHARVFWADERAAPVTVDDVSAHGCRVTGARVPAAGTHVFLSLDVADLPNVRLPATAIRLEEDGAGKAAALRFDVPVASTRGLDLLLSQRVAPAGRKAIVLVVDRNALSRARIAEAASGSGADVICVDDASRALMAVRREGIDVVLARCDGTGMTALGAVADESPGTLRVGFGSHEQVAQAIAYGHAQALADDPCSAKWLFSMVSFAHDALEIWGGGTSEPCEQAREKTTNAGRRDGIKPRASQSCAGEGGVRFATAERAATAMRAGLWSALRGSAASSRGRAPRTPTQPCSRCAKHARRCTTCRRAVAG